MKWTFAGMILLGLLLVGVVVWLYMPRASNTSDGPPAKGTTIQSGSLQAPDGERKPLADLPILDRCPPFEAVTAEGETVCGATFSGRALIITFADAGVPLEEQPTERLASRLAGSLEAPELAGDVVLLALFPSSQPGAAEVSQWLDAVRQQGGSAPVWARIDVSTSADFLRWAERWVSREGSRPSISSSEKEDADRQPISDLYRHALLIDPQGELRGVYDLRSATCPDQILSGCRTVLEERVLLVESRIEPRSVVRTLIDPPWLAARQRQQMEVARSLDVVWDFSFEDRRRESGISFRHRAVDDAGRSLVTAHYDHGNGVLAADVDNDGWVDLYFLNQVGANELWRNRGDGTFENVTARAGVAVADQISVSGAFGDIDNDGDADLFVTTVRGGNRLFENDGRGNFQDISASAGVDYKGHSSGALFFDFDRDGLLDLLVVNVGVYTTEKIRQVVNDRYSGPDTASYSYYASNPDAFAAHLKPERAERSLLYRNLGGNRFEEVAENVGLVDLHWTGDASAVDFNGDGWPDVYFTCMQGHDEYYENREGKRFERRSRERFPATPWGTMGIKVMDFENDGMLDLFLTDMHTDMLKNLSPGEEEQKIPPDLVDLNVWATDGNHILGNAFFRAKPDGSFEEVSDQIGAEMYWPWGLSAADVNADGYEDVFITASMNFPFRYATNVLLLNDRGKRFVRAEFLLGVEPRRYRRTATPWFELDLLGRDAQHPIAQLMAARGRRVGRAVVWGALGSRASVVWDFDEDGDLDIVTNDFHSEPMVLISNFAQRHPEQHYLKVKLVGRRSNRDALGAVVRVTAAGIRQTRVHDGQSGYLSHSMLPLYFGLGKAYHVSAVEITWPSGLQQRLENIQGVDRLMIVVEPDAEHP